MNKWIIRIFASTIALGAFGTLWGANADVTISNYQFTDGSSHSSTTTINQGDTVTWHWSIAGHSTTSGTCTQGGGYYGEASCNSSGLWDSGVVEQTGAVFMQTFPNAGIFPYYCSKHGSMGMVGQITVNAVAQCGTITLSPAALSAGVQNVAYSQTVSASGGTAPYTFTMTSGSFPPGVQINGATGAITGMPTGTGVFHVTITATDSKQCTGDQAFSISVSGDSPAGDPVVVPGVGSLPGAFGSVFRTQLQMTNGTESTISGNIVFHTGGVSGSANDPSMAYTLGSWQTINFDDVLPAMGLANALGSADIVPTSGPAPSAFARIFNDGGAAGTNGFSEPVFSAAQASQTNDSFVFILPADATNYRFNLGVRTLSSGVSASFTVWDASGNLVATVQKSFGPNFFVQQTGAQFLGVNSLPAGGSIGVTVTQGSGVFFAPTVDNRSQDTSTQFSSHN